jgi:hypothetical protein
VNSLIGSSASSIAAQCELFADRGAENSILSQPAAPQDDRTGFADAVWPLPSVLAVPEDKRFVDVLPSADPEPHLYIALPADVDRQENAPSLFSPI